MAHETNRASTASAGAETSAPSTRLRYKEASRYTNIPEGTLRAMVCTKRIPHIRVSSRLVLFETAALDAWLAERTVAPTGKRTTP